MKQFQTLSEINSDFTVCIVMESLIAYSLIKKFAPSNWFFIAEDKEFHFAFFFFFFSVKFLLCLNLESL